MSYEQTDILATFAGNGSTEVVYPVSFGYDSDSEIKATVDGAAFTEFELVEGGVRTTTPVSPASTLVVFRDTPITQPKTFDDGVLPKPTELEQGVNRATRQLQELANRSLRVPAGEKTPDFPANTTRVGKYFKGRADGGFEPVSAAVILSESGGAPNGVGLPAGGDTEDVLVKTSTDDADAGWGVRAKPDGSNLEVPAVKTVLGVSNVDNTSDADKPLSTAAQAALANKVDTIQGPFADDAAATIGGVYVPDLYRKDDGSTRWNKQGRVGSAYTGSALFQGLAASFSLDDLGGRDAHNRYRLAPTGSPETAVAAFGDSVRSVRMPTGASSMVTADQILGSGDWAISCWIYLESAPGAAATIISQYKTTGDARAFRLLLNTDRTLDLAVSDDGTSGGLTTLVFPTALPLTTWTHLTIEHEDGVECRLKINGSAADVLAYTAGMGNVAAGFGLNGYDGGGSVGARIRFDQCHIFTRVLTAGEITSLESGLTYHDDLNPAHDNEQFAIGSLGWGWTSERAKQDATIAKRGAFHTTLTKSSDDNKTLAITGSAGSLTVTTNKDELDNDYSPTVFTDGGLVDGSGTPTATLNGGAATIQTVIPDAVSGTVCAYGPAHCFPLLWKMSDGSLHSLHVEACRGETYISENSQPLGKVDRSDIPSADKALNDRYHYSRAGCDAGNGYDLLISCDHNKKLYAAFGAATGGTWSPDANGWQLIEDAISTYCWLQPSLEAANTYWLLARSSSTNAYGLTLYKITGSPGNAITVTVDRLISTLQRGYPRGLKISTDGTNEFVSIGWQERLSSSWEGSHVATYDVTANLWKSANGADLSNASLGTDATPRFTSGELAQDGHSGAGTRILSANSTLTRYACTDITLSYDTATEETDYLVLIADGNSNNSNAYMGVDHFFAGGWDSGSGYAAHTSTKGNSPFGLDDTTYYRTHGALVWDDTSLILVNTIRGPQVPKNGPDGENSTEEYYSFGGVGMIVSDISTLWGAASLDTAIAALSAPTTLRVPLAAEDTIPFVNRAHGEAGVMWNQPIELIGYSCTQMGFGFAGTYEFMSRIQP